MTEQLSMPCRSKTAAELEGHWALRSLPSPPYSILAPPQDACPAQVLTAAGRCAQGHRGDSGFGPQNRHGPPIDWQIGFSIFPPFSRQSD